MLPHFLGQVLFYFLFLNIFRFRIIDTHTQSSVDLDEKWKGNNKNDTHSQSDDDDDRFALIEEKPQVYKIFYLFVLEVNTHMPLTFVNT